MKQAGSGGCCWGSVFLVLVGLAGCNEENPVFLSEGYFPIINGQIDLDPEHSGIVAIQVGWGLCTGSLIHGSRTILTAGHCAADFPTHSMYVYFGNRVDTAQTRRVAAKKVHPDYAPGSEYDPPRNDIALLRLSTDAPSTAKPLPFLPRRLSLTSQDIGRTLEFVGFGETENGELGVKMRVVNQLNWLCDHKDGCIINYGGGSFLAAPNNLCQDQDPGGTCGGDSGGPALIERDGQVYVAGVTSFGDEHCEAFGCNTRVDAYEKFIVDFVGRLPGATCESGADCDSGVCAGEACCEGECEGECVTCGLETALGKCLTVANHTPCSDGNVCNGEEVCILGRCMETEPLACDDGDPCTENTCHPVQGCLFQPKEDGALCLDDDPCNGQETCLAGFCQPGETLVCDDFNPCTEDKCETGVGCQHEPVLDGVECLSDICGKGACLAGVCIFSEGPNCDDQNPCTEGRCDAKEGCLYQPLEDGTDCGECRQCQNGVCIQEEGCSPKGTGCGCDMLNQVDGAGWLCFLLGIYALGFRTRKTS